MSGQFFMPLWTDAYLGDTRHLTTVQHGAYILLLMTMWRNGGTLPNEDKRMARTVGLPHDRWMKIRKEVMALFDVEGDSITQKRLSVELKKTIALSEKRASAGSAGGRAKSLKSKEATVANAKAGPQQSPTLPDPTPTPTPTTPYGVEGIAGEAPSDSPEALAAFQASEANKPDPDAVVFSRGCVVLTRSQQDQLKAAFPHIKFDRELGSVVGFVETRFNQNKRAGKSEDWWGILWAALAKKDREAEERGQILKANAAATAAAALKAGDKPRVVRTM